MAAELEPCGTPAAYRRHLDYSQGPCDACKAAMRPTWARHRAANRARQARRLAARNRMERDIREVVHILACALGEGRQL